MDGERILEWLIGKGIITEEEFSQRVEQERQRMQEDPTSVYGSVEMMGQQLVEKDLQLLELRSLTNFQGQQIVELELKIMEAK